MAKESTRKIRIRGPMAGLWRIGLYYLILFGVTYVLAQNSDIVHAVLFEKLQSLSQAAARASDVGVFQGELTGTPFAEMGIDTTMDFVVVTLLSLLGALALMIPVVWVYLLTKQRRGYDESVVQALLILPVAAAGIIFIVQFSLTLAFSLAGIVAAVRWRTTLKDTKDAVYVFLAIGVGIASGVMILGVATILTLVFNSIILYLYWSNFGNIYADQRGRTGAMGLADVLAGPGSRSTALAVGDHQLLEAMTQDEIRDVATRVARMDRYLTEESKRRKRERLNGLLLVHTDQLVGAQSLVDEILGHLAFRFELAEILPGMDGRSVLEYLVRLNKEASPARLMELLNSAPGGQISAAEYRSLDGLTS